MAGFLLRSLLITGILVALQELKSDAQQPGAAPPSNTPPSPRTPEKEKQSFRLADPELTVELAAAEPDVVSPVAIAWDADGRMYVAEMPGYPATEKMGRIKRLEDRDQDGRYEHAVVFADGLNFPNSVMPYKDGVFVTDAPDILFLADTNDDGVADVRRVEWTGFTAASQQLRANALHWAVDNWIYGANGRNDGAIRRPDAPEKQAVSIRARDFRFDPRSGRFEAILGQSQFGQMHDDWGNRFLSWNTIPVRHVSLPDEFTDRSELVPAAVVDIADARDTGEVFPVSPPPRQFNGERANSYNALCGLCIFRGDALGTEYLENAFVGESLTNLVTRRVLVPTGATFTSLRAPEEMQREFLAAEDPWFHPVFITGGPDGALYIVDFYRELVEHPIYVASQKIRESVDWRHGFELGRLWRVRNRDVLLSTDSRRPRLSRASTDELVRELSSPVGWFRDTAQRLLVEGERRDAVPALKEAARRFSPAWGRVHALATLDGLGALQADDVANALTDEDAHVRRHGLKLAHRIDPLPKSLAEEILVMANDPDSAVRFQWALELGRLKQDQAIPALARMLDANRTDRRLCAAAVSSAGDGCIRLARTLVELNPLWLAKPDGEQMRVLVELGEAVGNRAAGQDVARLVVWAVDEKNSGQPLVMPGSAALVAGVARAASLQGKRLPSMLQGTSETTPQIPRRFKDALQQALAVAGDNAQPIEVRLAAVDLVGSGAAADVGDSLIAFVGSSQPVAVRKAAAAAVARYDDAALIRKLYADWSQQSDQSRRAILQSALESPAAARVLAEMLAAKTVLPTEIPAEIEAQLSRVADKDLRDTLSRLLGPSVAADRSEAIAGYGRALTLAGDPQRGAVVYAKNCLNCHTIQRFGQTIGPDLSGVSNRPAEALLADILDPSRRVSRDYLMYTVVTTGAKTYSGLIAAETDQSITIKTTEGQQAGIARGDIAVLKASDKSLMPDGVEKKIDVQQMADLLEFLRQPRRALLESLPAGR